MQRELTAYKYVTARNGNTQVYNDVQTAREVYDLNMDRHQCLNKKKLLKTAIRLPVLLKIMIELNKILAQIMILSCCLHNKDRPARYLQDLPNFTLSPRNFLSH